MSRITLESISRDDDVPASNTIEGEVKAYFNSEYYPLSPAYFLRVRLLAVDINIDGYGTVCGWIRTGSSIQDHFCISAWKTDEGWRQLSIGLTYNISTKTWTIHRQSYMLTSTLGQAPIYNTSYLPKITINVSYIIGVLAQDLE